VIFPSITASAIFSIMAACAAVAVAGGGFALVHARRTGRATALAEAAVLTEVAELAQAELGTAELGTTDLAGPADQPGVAVLAEPPLTEPEDAALVPVDKLSWRMPPLSELPAPVIRGARRIGLLGLRGYLAIAMVMVIVKIVETALGH
jgi:hypothetical protein